MNISELYERSYAPYSKRFALAVVQSQKGAFFPGVRIENISFPLTIDAVQNALFCCLSERHQPQKIYTESDQKKDPVLGYWIEEKNLERADLHALNSVDFFDVRREIARDSINQELQKLLKNPYVEYSNFPVSALVETESGDFISGINIETRDWSKGLCAERVALAKALSYGVSDFKALHISTLHGEYNSPCGACRQVILEHLPHKPVYLYYADGTHAFHFSDDLLPYSFQSSELRKQDQKP